MSAPSPNWGSYTGHAMQVYPQGLGTISPRLIHAFGVQKLASARANRTLQELPLDIAQAIGAAAEELASGRLDSDFPLSPWQAGDGNQTHINVNEVLATRATALHPARSPVHALDHVNRNQSSNDCWPTVARIALSTSLCGDIDGAMERLSSSLARFARQHKETRKVGRTFLRDAHFTTIGDEFGAFAELIADARSHLQTACNGLLQVPQGAGAVGTGVGIHPAFAVHFARELASLTGRPYQAPTLPCPSQTVDLPLLRAADAMLGISVACMKLCRDIELLASGPRCGMGELILPAVGPGSSSMAGKINPTHASMLEMVCLRVQANHGQAVASLAGGRLQLNTTYLLAVTAALESAELLAQGIEAFTTHCLDHLQVDTAQLQLHAQAGPGTVFLRSRELGYDAVSRQAG